MDGQLLHDLWRRLNQQPLLPIRPEWSQNVPTFAEAFEYFRQNTNATTINIRLLSETDAKYLAERGISSAHLARNLKKTLKGSYFDSRAFQLTALKDRAVYAVCPFGGKQVESRHSLLANINVLFYRFVGERVFYVAIAGIGSGFKKSALYFPDFETLVTSGDDWGLQQDDLAELKTRMVVNFKDCHRYLSEDRPDVTRKVAICLGCYHFAHHLWNELSGLRRQQKKRLLNQADCFFVAREPLGRLDEIFPEIPSSQIKRVSSSNELFREILVGGYLAMRLGDDFIERDLVGRVQRVARQRAIPATLEKISDAKARCSPLLWVGIRIGNRAWADQAKGLARLIDELRLSFPKLGVVFDGFSLPADRLGGGEESVLISQEMEVVAEVIERLQQSPHGCPPIYNIIGLSIADSLVWANSIDFYLSPYGSLQHKVGWFANKPGLIHTNKTLLKTPAHYVWSAVENAIQPVYIGAEHVIDACDFNDDTLRYNEIDDASDNGAGIRALNSERRKKPVFNNYFVDSSALHQSLLNLMRSRWRLSGFVDRLVHRAKFTGRQVCWRLTDVLDGSKL